MSSASVVTAGVYRCVVCGAELAVIRGSEVEMCPFCCNTKMELTHRRNPVYFCPICKSELMGIRPGTGRFEPVCCNRPMLLKQVAGR